MKTTYTFLKNFSLLLLVLLALNSCNNNNGDSLVPQKEKTMKNLVIANNFEWKTSKPANLIITAKDNEGQPVAGAKFSIFTENPENGGKLIVSGVTNTSGIYSVDYSVPAYYSALYVRSDFVGLPTPGMVSLDNNGFNIALGGKQRIRLSSLKKLLKVQTPIINFSVVITTREFPITSYLRMTRYPVNFYMMLTIPFPKGENYRKPIRNISRKIMIIIST